VDIRVNDTLKMKKPHPCGGTDFLVLRSGMDFKLRCLTCGREIEMPRVKAEKGIRRVTHEDGEKA